MPVSNGKQEIRGCLTVSDGALSLSKCRSVVFDPHKDTLCNALSQLAISAYRCRIPEKAITRIFCYLCLLPVGILDLLL